VPQQFVYGETRRATVDGLCNALLVAFGIGHDGSADPSLIAPATALLRRYRDLLGNVDNAGS
jgi:hypothetical protein